MQRIHALVPLLLASAAGPALAQAGAAAAGAAQSARVAVAARLTGPIQLDGRLDEVAWSAAPVAGGFIQQQPDEGKPPALGTEVRFLYDDDALYVGARMYDSRRVTSRLARRDQDASSDLLTVDLDTFHDRLHRVTFTVNPAGVRGDALDGDASWDPVWAAAARVDSLGWTAELRIPFSQLHFSRDAHQVWGLELTRLTQRTHETDLWSFFSRSAYGGPAFFGVLEGLRLAHRPAHGELMPYAVGQSRPVGSGVPGDPLSRPHQLGVRAGLDARYDVSSSLALTATVNPDFGQVEVDPAVVNLTAYETYFQEKRPFFVEGSNLFSFGTPGCNINCGLGMDLFYSRRIGRAPQGAELAYAAGEFAQVPDNGTILGAAKLTGRTEHGTSIGILDAVTGRQTAEIVTTAGRRLGQPVEPLANAFVARVNKEYRGGDMVIGGIATSSWRDLTDPGLARLLDRDAETAGVDAQFWWGKRTYSLYLALSGSHAGGDTAAIGLLQRSSARYLQRPDRAPASNGLFTNAYDPAATALAGYGFISRLAKPAGDWLWDLNAASFSPGFEAGDLGFIRQVDWRWLNGTFGRQWTRPTAWYRALTVIAGAEQKWNYDGDRNQGDVTGFAQAQLPNYWQATVVVEDAPSYLDDRLTRGGPVVRRPGVRVIGPQLSTDSREPVVAEASVTYVRDDEGGYDVSFSPTLTFKPAPNVSLTAGPGWERSRTTDQYVTTVTDPTDVAFFGRRYVFSHIDQTTVSMTTRADVTFTPSLSLQLYAQPLLASGHYYDFQEFARPRVEQKLVYGRDVGTIAPAPGGYRIDPDGAGPAVPFTIGNPDFNFRSLRGTGVLRWEWRPGSTAYLVWTQTRTDVAALGDFDFGRDRAALFATHPQNVFLLKISYWLGR